MRCVITGLFGIFLGVFGPISSSKAMEMPSTLTGNAADDVNKADLAELTKRLFTLADEFKPNVTKREEVESILGVKFSLPEDERDQQMRSAMYAVGFRSLPFRALIQKDINNPNSSIWRFAASFRPIPFDGNLDECFSIHQARAELVKHGWINVETFISGDDHGVMAENKGIYIKFGASGGMGPIPEIDEIGGPPGSPASDDFYRRMQDGCISYLHMTSYKS